jgi:hypothetical protein
MRDERGCTQGLERRKTFQDGKFDESAYQKVSGLSLNDGQDRDRLRDDAVCAFLLCGTYADIGIIELLPGQVLRGIGCDGEE